MPFSHVDGLGGDRFPALAIDVGAEPIRILVEAAGQARLAVEDHRRDEGAGRETLTLQDLGQHRHVARSGGEMLSRIPCSAG